MGWIATHLSPHQPPLVRWLIPRPNSCDWTKRVANVSCHHPKQQNCDVIPRRSLNRLPITHHWNFGMEAASFRGRRKGRP